MPDRQKLKARARAMRNEPTPAERALWRELRNGQLDGLKFRRQVPLGRYIADFACMYPRLIVEADGGQHAESEDDARRDEWLTAQGFRVLRFWNVEVQNETEGVLTAIRAAAGRSG